MHQIAGNPVKSKNISFGKLKSLGVALRQRSDSEVRISVFRELFEAVADCWNDDKMSPRTDHLVHNTFDWIIEH
jgi:hypothetical protein